jgi:hypothetical protein
MHKTLRLVLILVAMIAMIAVVALLVPGFREVLGALAVILLIGFVIWQNVTQG